MDKYIKAVRLYSGNEKTLIEIRNHLQKFIGGSVDLTRRDDGFAIVTLNHSEKKNAMSGKMMVDLYDVVEELEKWKEGKGLILKGADGNFCSGGDLNFARATGTAEEGFMMSTLMQDALNRFQRLPLISVAVVEGSGAIGGGAELSVACDYRIVSEMSQGIGFVHGKMCIIPAWGGTKRLVERIGYRKALEVLSKGRIMSPSECIHLGLADEVIPESENCLDYAISWLQERTKFNADVIRAMKVSCCVANDLPNDTEVERRIFAPFWGSPANKEALSMNIKHKAGKS
ncbi:UNVERIFIED_CONTAM: hypothetical protein PYX00_007312 [Menopon gallinae]|uniref:Uncharacterized protein n=1 Tax=Menopon gallinae TaxID=328185 RepID=A0AAW2HJH7_9NEOP